MLGDAEGRTEHRLRRGRAHEDQEARPHGLDLGVQPRPAGADLLAVRLLMEPPLAAPDPPEMLDGVSDVDAGARDAGRLEALVEDAARRSDERLALHVLAIPRLLADEHHRGLPRAVAEHGL